MHVFDVRTYVVVAPRWFLKWWRRRSSEKQETSVNLYMRWEQDNDYGMMNKLGLFEEYLEMGTFITPISHISRART